MMQSEGHEAAVGTPALKIISQADSHQQNGWTHAATTDAHGEATTKALHILELFEMVLLNVPTRQLLVLQRVCREWRDRIGASLPLQVKLYLTASSTVASAGSGMSATQTNPLFPQLIKQLVRYHRAPGSHLAPPTSWHIAEASWQRMFLFASARSEAHIHINPRAKVRRGKKQQKFDVYVIDQEGVKLGHVWRALDARLHALGGLKSEVTNVAITHGERSETFELKAEEELRDLPWGVHEKATVSDLVDSLLGPLGLLPNSVSM